MKKRRNFFGLPPSSESVIQFYDALYLVESLPRGGQTGGKERLARREHFEIAAAVAVGHQQETNHIMPTVTHPAAKPCAMMVRAPLMSLPDSFIPAITDAPMPNISPSPVETTKSGATMFTAAMPLAPHAPTDKHSVDKRQDGIEYHTYQSREENGPEKTGYLSFSEIKSSFFRFI